MRSSAAFTLIEALLSISLAAVAGSILLLGVTSSIQTTSEALQQTIAEGIAQQLMDEVVGGRYHSKDVGPYPVTFGPSLWESNGVARERYDDIDDYDDISNQPPTDAWGIELGQDDGEGGLRHTNFQAPAGFFDHWREEIEVSYVNEAAPTTPLRLGLTSDYRLVTVRIVYVDPQWGERVLAELQQVVAYVPSL